MKLARLMGRKAVRNRISTASTLTLAASTFLVSSLHSVLTCTYLVQDTQQDSPHLRLALHRASPITEPVQEAYRERIALILSIASVAAGYKLQNRMLGMFLAC